MGEFKVVGKNTPRVDGKAKIVGTAVYADDINMPGMLYGKVVRCLEYGHARVTRLDMSEAAKMPGVVKVLRPEDVCQNVYNQTVVDLMASEQMAHVMGDIDDQNIFTSHVKHQGDSVCGIIATSPEAAERAAEKVIIEYEELPAILNGEQAKNAEFQFDERKPQNKAFDLPKAMFPEGHMGWGDVDKGFEDADLVVEDTFYVSKQKQCQMEPNTYVALWDEQDRLKCWTSCQMPKLAQRKLANIFELPVSNVKVQQTVVGGGFGARLGLIVEPETCAMAMAVPGRAVKVQSPREEDWLLSPSRHPGHFRIKMGFKKDGTPVAQEAHFESWKGAYYLDSSAVLFCAGSWLTAMYKWENYKYTAESYYTNQSVCGAYRGYGNPQSTFASESLIDRACNELGIDPLEWRKKFHKGVGDKSWLATDYASCGLNECIEKASAEFGWEEKKAKYANQTGSKRRGIGVCTGTHTSGAAPMILEHTVISVRLNEDASATLNLACSDIGQGSHTSLRQIAAETLGLPLEKVFLATGDTDAAGFDIGAHASRTLFVGGNAVFEACNDAKRQLFDRAAKLLEANPDDLQIEEGIISVKGSPSKTVSAEEICRNGVYHFNDVMTGQPVGEPGQIVGNSSYMPDHNAPPFAATFCEVEVDMETGEYELIDLVTGYDIGQAINPAIVHGQLDGGTQHGLGMGVIEEMYYDEKGRCTNAGFTDYKQLGPSDLPPIKNILIEEPDPNGPYGAKSVGELSLVTPLGAVANAIYNATGIQFTDLPITPEKILKALSANKSDDKSAA
jgi:xanthine dehydrogenase molybdenum-binding subunit